MDGYFEDIYGKRSKEFIDGVIAGIEAFAIWKDGTQVVGCLEHPMKETIESVKKQLG